MLVELQKPRRFTGEYAGIPAVVGINHARVRDWPANLPREGEQVRRIIDGGQDISSRRNVPGR